MSSNKRPESLPFPQIWAKYTAKDPKTGQLIEYRIQDLPEECFDAIPAMVREHFLPDEPAGATINFMEDEESVEELIGIYKELLKQKLSIGCFREDTNELVGYHVLNYSHKDDPEKQAKGRAWKIISDYNTYGFNQVNIFEKYQVDTILGELGLCVHRNYRGLGLARELLKVRVKVAEVLGLKVTSGGFSGIGSQRAAEQAGYITDYEIDYNDLAKIGWKFEGIETKAYRIMTGIAKGLK